MADSYDHLDEKVRPYLLLSDKERMQRILVERWIGYTIAKDILAHLEELIERPKSHRMRNLLIVGDTNNGKTMILLKFLRLHRPQDNPDGDAIIYPVMIIQSPSVPDEGRIYNAILQALHSPFNEKDHPDKKRHMVITQLRAVGLKVLVFDEMQDMIAGNPKKQRQCLNTIKYLGNELQIPIVGAGIKEVYNFLASDPQLSNRFDPVELPHWEIGDDYMDLLASFEMVLPLKKPSNLAEDSLAIKLLGMSGGLIGELSTILQKASIEAIKSKKEYIDEKILDSIKWVAPSDRQYLKKFSS